MLSWLSPSRLILVSLKSSNKSSKSWIEMALDQSAWMSSELASEKERTERNSCVSYKQQIPMEMVQSTILVSIK